MLYIQKSVSENAGIAVIGVEKYKNFRGENTPRPPYYWAIPFNIGTPPPIEGSLHNPLRI
jgi:hypothetical protein